MITLKEIFPGCQYGFCMPCGGRNGIRNDSFATPSLGYVDQRICREHREKGCPNPIPKPNHSYNKKGNCDVCGYEPRYITTDGKLFSSIALAKRAGYKVSELINEDNFKMSDCMGLDDLVIVQEKSYSEPQFVFTPGWVKKVLFEKLVKKKIGSVGCFTFHGSLRKIKRGNTPDCYLYGYAEKGGRIATINQVLNQTIGTCSG